MFFKKFSGKLLIYIFLIIVVISILLPLYYMFITSFKSHDEYLSNKLNIPEKFVMQNYISIIMKSNFLRFMYNSFQITILSTILCIVAALLAAFAFVNYKFRFKNILYILILSLMSIPPIVMIIPLFIQMGKFKLIGNQFSAIIIYIGLTLPFSIFLLTNFFKTVPNELKEAALIDGCSDMQYFIKVMIPLSKPAIATLAIVNGIWVWNELLVALVFLPNDKSRTLMSAIMLNMGKTELNIPLITSGLVVASIPILILFLVFQKWFVRGLIEGSIKG